MVSRILVHMCCGPCSIYPLRRVLADKHGSAKTSYDVHGFFYNPNIHPRAEFIKRLDAAKKLASLMELPVIFHEDYDPEPYFAGLTGMDKKSLPAAGRCTHCYQLRLRKTAEVAKANGFEYFSSSLLYSTFQNHENIIEEAKEAERETGVKFFYEDFRDGWQDGIEASKEMGLFRQNYCGCIFSKADRGLLSPRNKAEVKARNKAARKKGTRA
ncbi:FIG053235: Diacylglucosamine hydrolase like [hydrothermal vent metagenome]|uniref:FIG053235: Diacylglucosamine hydrolase like n=1 Tax=hydrothermal vent metagenome TaxID=652676 RepID=A0A3B0QYV4_9ZZZZ